MPDSSSVVARTGRVLAIAGVSLSLACSDAAGPGPGVPADPPAVTREFRGLWIATVANIDWPSAAGLPVATQRGELVALLDLAQSLNLNAVILQVRAAGDATYPSPYEPWARPLSGTQGMDPGWDPLAEAVDAAHERGLELHAWFNPFRAGNLADTNRLAPTHLYRSRPELGRIAQNQLWFDPGEPEVQDHVMRVIRDVVTRYDVDGVHLDDYFYPYPVSGASQPIQFPDDASYAKYLSSGGVPMDRGDWRRQNINRFVERLYREVKAERASVKVGLSPFGIWRPGNPPGITGLDAWRDLFADSRVWLEQGWLDYLAPQLYWSVSSTGQNFAALLNWWLDRNVAGRHVWPGLAAYRVFDGTTSAFAASEIGTQLDLMRAAIATRAMSRGALLYNATVVRANRGNLRAVLGDEFSTPAVIPASPWLDAAPPPTPVLSVSTGGQELRASWTSAAGNDAGWWLLRARYPSGWTTRLLWHDVESVALPALAGAVPDIVTLVAFDRALNASGEADWKR